VKPTEKRIMASDIENYWDSIGSNDYHIYSQGDYNGSDEVIKGIIELCRSNRDIEEIKKKLKYGIVGDFISSRNTFIGAKEALDKYMKDEFEEASQEVFDRNNYGWDMCFSQLLYNLKEKLDEQQPILKIVYIVIESYYDDTEILGVFSTREKALEHMGTINLGRRYIKEMKIDNPDENSEN